MLKNPKNHMFKSFVFKDKITSFLLFPTIAGIKVVDGLQGMSRDNGDLLVNFHPHMAPAAAWICSKHK